MAAAERRFSLGVLALAFVLGLSVMTLSMRTVRKMEYGEYGIPLWKGSREGVPRRYRVNLRLEGRLSEVEYPDWGYGPGAYSNYSRAMVFESTNPDHERAPRLVYFFDDEGDTGLIPSRSAGGFDVGDATFSKWVQALHEGWTIEVEGHAFDVMQDSKRITLFGVEKLLSTQRSDTLCMYKEVHASAMTGMVGTSIIPLPLPVRFEAGRIHRGDIWQDNVNYYGLRMDAGETIRYHFSSDRPIRFQLIFSNHTSFMDWRPDHILIEEPAITTGNSYLSAEWDGFYIFGFEGDDPASRVAFNALRKTGDVVLMPAWILGGRVGGGSGTRIEVNESDLSQFPHLLEAFEEDEKTTAVHADHMTVCPASEAIRIIEFFGKRYSRSVNSYGFKMVLEDGRMYSFGIRFSWVPPLVD